MYNFLFLMHCVNERRYPFAFRYLKYWKFADRASLHEPDDAFLITSIVEVYHVPFDRQRCIACVAILLARVSLDARRCDCVYY